MLLHHHPVLELDHCERIRDFNARADRGEFLMYTDERRTSSAPGRLSERVGQLGQFIRQRFSHRPTELYG